MRIIKNLALALLLLALSWYAMMVLHELGHVLGAMLTGGTVNQVMIHPLEISRTDVSPNPHPAIVVWLGPLLGCALPLIALAVLPKRLTRLRKIAKFFAGFCLIANGAYIAFGSFARVGDCQTMLNTGAPQWTLLAFGGATIPLGLYLWHTLGTLQENLGGHTE